MAIKKITAVKKSDPPKKWNPDRMITGKTFGKVLKPGQKSDTYYYMENVPAGGQGPIKNSPKELQYGSTPNISKMVTSQRVVKKSDSAKKASAKESMMKSASKIIGGKTGSAMKITMKTRGTKKK